MTAIERVEWGVHSQPLGGSAPLFALPETATTHVRVTAGGVSGTGYAYCWHSGVARALQVLGGELSRSLRGRDAETWGHELRPEIERAYVNFLGTEGMAAAIVSAVDLALWDWRCRAEEVGLETLLGRPSAPAPGYVSHALWPSVPADDCARLARGLVAEGFRGVKIWVGSPDIDREFARVQAVRDAVGPDVAVFVDANQTYSPEDAVRLAEVLVPIGVEWFEDPVFKDDVVGLAWVCARSPVPIATGENAWGLVGLRRVLDAAPIHAALLDLQRIGGITGWLDAARLCEAAGTRVTTHSFGHVGVRLLAGEPPSAGLVEVMPPLGDVFGPLSLEDGLLAPLEAPGALPEPIALVEWVDAFPP